MRHGQHHSSTSGQADLLRSSSYSRLQEKDTEDTDFADKIKYWKIFNNDIC